MTRLARRAVAPLGLLTALAAFGQAPAGKVVVVEDFESYPTDALLAKAWYRPPHGGDTRQTLEPVHKKGGKQGMTVAYRTYPEEGKHYAAICRVAKWDLTGCDAVRFWLKPDGSGRTLTAQLNIADARGKNIHDLWDYRIPLKAGDDAPRVVEVPFADLVHNTKYADSPDTSPVFKPAALIEVAFYIGGRGQEPGAGAYHFDDLEGFARGR